VAVAAVGCAAAAIALVGGWGGGGHPSDAMRGHQLIGPVSETTEVAAWQVPCAEPRAKSVTVGCTPPTATACKRFYVDGLFSPEEVAELTRFAKEWLSLGGAAGGPTILDLHSGALSLGENFIDVYQAVKMRNQSLYSAADFARYTAMKGRIAATVRDQFGVTAPLHLTKPTFFSLISDRGAVTEHDEYWHDHVDKVTYGSFDYTCLLYLSTHGDEFDGGEFIFSDGDRDRVVRPRAGRLSCFTSGPENTHRISKVSRGRRLALTVAFTCAHKHAIPDPHGKQASTSEAVPE